MPYFVHDGDKPEGLSYAWNDCVAIPYGSPDDLPEDSPYRRMYASKAEAVAARTGTQKITFIPTGNERSKWHNREYDRLWYDVEGKYTRLPSAIPTVQDHYAHRAKGSTDKIAFTPDDTFGHEDRQLVLSLGRYLERYMERLGITASDIPRYVGLLKAGEMPLQFATTADDIGRVYCADRGPTSCMDGTHDWDWTDCPTRVYAGGDLSVAYIGKLGEDPTDDIITARAVVWAEKKAFVRAYGDMDTILPLLQAQGFTQIYEWTGARIPREDVSGRAVVMPYLDGDCQRARSIVDNDGNRWMVVDPTGKWICGRTDGKATKGSAECYHCGGELTDDDDDRYCSDHWTCSECGCHSCNPDDEYSGREGSICESCYEDHSHRCQHCDEHFNTADWGYSDMQRHERIDPLYHICPECLNNGIRKCGDCGEYDKVAEFPGVPHHICTECARDRRRISARPRGILLRHHTVESERRHAAA